MRLSEGVRAQLVLSHISARCRKVFESLFRGKTLDWEMAVTTTIQWKISGENVSETTRVTITSSTQGLSVTEERVNDFDGPN
jgi:hypothetical protein